MSEEDLELLIILDQSMDRKRIPSTILKPNRRIVTEVRVGRAQLARP